MFSCALKIISKPHAFYCALIFCVLLNYPDFLATFPQNTSIILQMQIRFYILPFQTWGYYFTSFSVQETESQKFALNRRCKK